MMQRNLGVMKLCSSIYYYSEVKSRLRLSLQTQIFQALAIVTPKRQSSQLSLE